MERTPPAFLGQKLFFETRLSRTGTTACASCHHPAHAFTEPRRVSISDTGTRGRRNAPSLINASFLSTLMWDGRFRTLEQQALGPFRRGEMGIGVDEVVHRLNSDPDYVQLFRQSFDRHPTADGIARALAAYQRTLVSGESRIERFLRTSEQVCCHGWNMMDCLSSTAGRHAAHAIASHLRGQAPGRVRPYFSRTCGSTTSASALQEAGLPILAAMVCPESNLIWEHFGPRLCGTLRARPLTCTTEALRHSRRSWSSMTREGAPIQICLRAFAHYFLPGMRRRRSLRSCAL